MGENQTKPNNDNDIVNLKEKNNDIDNDNVGEIGTSPRERVLGEISEYKLDIIRRFMFGGDNKFFGDSRTFMNEAVKQLERFTYIWMDELSENARKDVIDYYLFDSIDERSRDYTDYMNSPVWKYISSIIKMLNGYVCANCKERFNPAHLSVHHRTYAHLGSELHHLDELDVLCNDCHMKIHGIRRSK